MSLVAVPLAISVAAPARASDTAVCTGSAQVFAVDTGGAMWRYGLSGPLGNTPAWSTREQIGRGWSGFGRVLGGPGGRIYGINAQGVQQYKYFNGAWSTSRHITDSWTAYATAAYRNKITVDEIGDFYLVDGSGRLRWSRYNEQTSTWTVYNKVLATGWGRFDLIVAGTAGTLYAREPQGKLFRFQYDPASQRWLEQERLVGSGWHKFARGLMSAGGDVLFGITAAGDIHHYRFREDNGTWPVGGGKIGSGWQVFPNVAATTNTCELIVDHSPVRPSLPVTSSAVDAIQAGSDFQSPGALHFAYTEDGALFNGSAFAADPAGVDWTEEPGSQDYTGKPALLAATNQTVQTVVQHTSSDLDLRGPGNTAQDLGTAMVATPVVVRLWNGALAAFGVGKDGSFWQRSQDETSGHLLPWTRLDGSGLTGELAAVTIGDLYVALFAVGPNGNLLTARYRDGALESPWASMGSGAFVGTPEVVKMPGPALRVFGRSAIGDIVVQASDYNGRFPGKWELVGDGSVRGTGSPAALLDDRTSRLYVFGRVGNSVYYFQETAAGAMTWGPGKPVAEGDIARSDPTAFSYQDGMHQGFETSAFVVRDATGGVSMWSIAFGAAAKNEKAGKAGKAAESEKAAESGKAKPAGDARFVKSVLARER